MVSLDESRVVFQPRNSRLPQLAFRLYQSRLRGASRSRQRLHQLRPATDRLLRSAPQRLRFPINRLFQWIIRNRPDLCLRRSSHSKTLSFKGQELVEPIPIPQRLKPFLPTRNKHSKGRQRRSERENQTNGFGLNESLHDRLQSEDSLAASSIFPDRSSHRGETDRTFVRKLCLPTNHSIT